jgi:hypothetical protein
MKVRRAGSAALIALAAGFTAAAPAQAAAPIVAGGSFARTAPFIDGYIVPWECHAVAAGAVSTTISSCVLKAGASSIPAPPVTQTGPVAATNEAVAQTSSSYQVCWTASATYTDGTSQATSGCSSGGPIAGAG